MNRFVLSLSTALIGLGIVQTSGAAPTKNSGTIGLPVCSRPSASWSTPYKSFAPYELGLRLPRQIKPNVDYSSVIFYAVVLKVAPVGSEPSCDQGEFSSSWENQRKRVQSLVPQKKAFADQQCPDMAAVSYLMGGKSSTRPFIAVYGGSTRQDAQAVLSRFKSKYPKAKIAPMQVVFNQIVQ